jgi:two-component system, OmpR family, osmolarity sensor histidine kinase EnvZ
VNSPSQARTNRKPRTLAQQLILLMMSLLIISTLVMFWLAQFVLKERIAGAIAESALPSLQGAKLAGDLALNGEHRTVTDTRPVMRRAAQLMSQKLRQPVDLIEQNGRLYFVLRAQPQRYFQTYPIDREVMWWLVLSWLITAALLIGAAMGFAWYVRRPLLAIAQIVDQPDQTPKAIISGSAEIQKLASHVIDAFQRERASHSLRSHLLTGFAHDVGTPLMRLKLALAILQTEPELHTQMQQDVEQLAQLRESLLRQIRLGELEAMQTLDLTIWLVDYQQKRGDSSIQFVIPASCEASIMPMAMRRILDNLLDNATRHGRAPIRVELVTDAPSWSLKISDAGEGIPANKLHELQQPFAKGQQSAGHGMGLTIVRQLAELMRLQLEFGVGAEGGLAINLAPDQTQVLKQRRAR